MNKYRASIATAVLGALTLSHGQTLGRNSFSSSMIAKGFSKFRGVKTPPRSQSSVIATSAKVDSPLKKETTPVVVAVLLVPHPASDAKKPEVSAQNSNTKAKTQVPPANGAKTAPAAAKKDLRKEYFAGRPLTAAEFDKIIHSVAALEGGPLADPKAVFVEMPEPDSPGIDLGTGQNGTRNLKLKWVTEGYFDAGYEMLLGTFSTQTLRYGLRYGQDEVHGYITNTTLDTRGTGLAYPQAVTGLSAGVEAWHWFPQDKIYVSFSWGEGLEGLNKGLQDIRYGVAGFDSWGGTGHWHGDIYGELFYVQLASDTFFDMRLRSGQIIKRYGSNYLWSYVVGQFWVSGLNESPTENRFEFGPGIGYQMGDALSINLELRAGYAFGATIDNAGDHVYFNPTIIIAGGFYNGFYDKH